MIAAAVLVVWHHKIQPQYELMSSENIFADLEATEGAAEAEIQASTALEAARQVEVPSRSMSIVSAVADGMHFTDGTRMFNNVKRDWQGIISSFLLCYGVQNVLQEHFEHAFTSLPYNIFESVPRSACSFERSIASEDLVM